MQKPHGSPFPDFANMNARFLKSKLDHGTSEAASVEQIEPSIAENYEAGRFPRSYVEHFVRQTCRIQFEGYGLPAYERLPMALL